MNTILIHTTQGKTYAPVMHKKGALQVVEFLDQDPVTSAFYNITHNNGLRLPQTDTDSLEDAILICNWCAENFPEFAKEDVNISEVSESRKQDFRDQLYEFRFIKLRDWEDSDDFPF